MENHTPLNYALWLLGRRDRSVGEIQNKMREKKFEESDIKKTINTLKVQNFLDDKKFARHYIENQLVLKPVGKYVLKQKLKQKFISDKIIDETLKNIDTETEYSLANEAAKKWQRKHADLDINDQKTKEKLTRYLISHGFDWETIKQII